MSEFTEVFQPFIDLFTQSQVNTILLAWLPVKFGPYMTGIMTVDMFLTSIIASGISTLALAIFKLISLRSLNDPIKNENTVTVQIEYYYEGIYGDLSASIFYESLSWLISNQTKQLDKGAFIVRHTNSTNHNDDDECAPPNFNILPEKNQQITIEYKGLKFDVSFSMPPEEKKDENSNNNNNNNNNNNHDYYYYGSSSKNKPKPSIFITTTKESSTSIDIITDYLNEITRSYLETQRKMKVRSRYERNSSYWYHVQTLSCNRNLDSVALDESQEILLKRELDTFINDKDFYDRIGIPYRRGIILYGKPGTGKTSLINAISSHLSRDTYYLNLKTISDDNELSAAFSSVPANQIIVLEDVDTQSKVLHKRTKKISSYFSVMESLSLDKKDNTNPTGPNSGPNSGPTGPMGPSLFSKFSLSTFLGCLDGNILAEGNIIIMTTNHVDHLDPACIRPGRMDVHLDLGYCTHYQIRKMYKTISENPKAEFPKDILEKIPERLLPPCEVMMAMVLYRNDIHLIPEKIYELVLKYKDMTPEEIAKKMEEEALLEAQRISEASAESEENKEVKEEVKDENKDEKDEAKDENKEKEEEVKDENQEKKEEVKEEVKDENKNEKDEIKVENKEKEEVKVENQEKKEVEDEVKVENKNRKENVKDENKEKKEEVKEEFKSDNKDEKEEGKDENKKKEDIKKDVKDENKDNEEKIKNENESKNKIEIIKKEKLEEEIIKKEIEKERIIKCEVINKEE